MTIGYFLGLALAAVAVGAIAIKQRNAVKALLWLPFLAYLLRAATSGLVDATRFASSIDNLLLVIALFVGATTLLLFEGLPRAIDERLWSDRREGSFDRRLFAARQPFVDAARADEADLAAKAQWHRSFMDVAPSPEWESFRQHVAAADARWAWLVRDRAPLEELVAIRERIAGAWEPLRARYQARARARHRFERGLLVVAGVIYLAGFIHIGAALTSAPPTGRASNVPAMPAGRSATFVSINGFPDAVLSELADFYAERYGIQVRIARMVGFESAVDPERQQVVAEKMIESMRINFNQAREPGSVVIGVTDADLYVTSQPDWAYAFGKRVGARLGLISTARMTSFGPFSDRIASARLRKLVTKYIGTMYFGLTDSSDPRSTLYRSILGPEDLDGMGEDF